METNRGEKRKRHLMNERGRVASQNVIEYSRRGKPVGTTRSGEAVDGEFEAPSKRGRCGSKTLSRTTGARFSSNFFLCQGELMT